MTFRIGRREVITLLGGAAATVPFGARAQPSPKIARLGFLGATTPSGFEKTLPQFRLGLRDLGYIEGQNILIDFRWAEGNYARLSEYAAELIRLRADILLTHGTPGTLAAKQATTTVPIVMLVSGDAVATGIIASLARPGGNVTGSTFFDPELQAKRLELIKEVLPSARRVAVLKNPGNPVVAATISAMQRTADSLKLEMQLFDVQRADRFPNVIASVVKARTDAVVATSDSVLRTNAGRLAELMLEHRLPSVGDLDFVNVGGLLGYGVNLGDLWYRGAYFVDEILKGVKPANLPVEQPTKFELVINLKTAKALGLDVPPTLLARADHVIE
jgi:putative tryptophan/tyrosine transport system substrate-binding protein